MTELIIAKPLRPNVHAHRRATAMVKRGATLHARPGGAWGKAARSFDATGFVHAIGDSLKHLEHAPKILVDEGHGIITIFLCKRVNHVLHDRRLRGHTFLQLEG